MIRTYSKGIATVIIAMLLGLVMLFAAMIMLPPIAATADAVGNMLNQSADYWFYTSAVLNFVPFFFILSLVVAVVLAIVSGGGGMVGGR